MFTRLKWLCLVRGLNDFFLLLNTNAAFCCLSASFVFLHDEVILTRVNVVHLLCTIMYIWWGVWLNYVKYVLCEHGTEYDKMMEVYFCCCCPEWSHERSLQTKLQMSQSPNRRFCFQYMQSCVFAALFWKEWTYHIFYCRWKQNGEVCLLMRRVRRTGAFGHTQRSFGGHHGV